MRRRISKEVEFSPSPRAMNSYFNTNIIFLKLEDNTYNREDVSEQSNDEVRKNVSFMNLINDDM